MLFTIKELLYNIKYTDENYFYKDDLNSCYNIEIKHIQEVIYKIKGELKKLIITI